MKKIFIGGSRRITELNKGITNKLDNFMKEGMTILVGDANGADKSVQNYLAYKNYDNVIVFCMENNCRNNIGRWNTKSIETGLKDKNFDYYSTKDLQMVKETDYAFMIWDTKSKGTLNNIQNIVKEGKTVFVYIAPEKKSYKVSSPTGLRKLLTKNEQDNLNKREKISRPQSLFRQDQVDHLLIKPKSKVEKIRVEHFTKKNVL